MPHLGPYSTVLTEAQGLKTAQDLSPFPLAVSGAWFELRVSKP